MLQVLAMLQRAHHCSGILARHLAARAALSGSGAPVLASVLAPLACAFTSSPLVAPALTLHTPAYTCAVPAHSFHTSVRCRTPVSSSWHIPLALLVAEQYALRRRMRPSHAFLLSGCAEHRLAAGPGLPG